MLIVGLENPRKIIFTCIDKSSFNEDISSWDVSNVVKMSQNVLECNNFQPTSQRLGNSSLKVSYAPAAAAR